MKASSFIVAFGNLVLPTRDRTRNSCSGTVRLNNWNTNKVPSFVLKAALRLIIKHWEFLKMNETSLDSHSSVGSAIT